MGRDLTLPKIDHREGQAKTDLNGLEITVDGGMFYRRAIKKHRNGDIENINWLVCEVDGTEIRIYIDETGTHAHITTKDLYP